MKLISFIINCYNKIKYNNDVFDRSHLGLFTINKMCSEMPYPNHDIIIDNNVYGVGTVLKSFSVFNEQINAYIEHGVYFGNHFDENRWYADKIITFSKQRKQHLLSQGVKKKIHVIGPYIHYAQELLSSHESLVLKKQLKKTILVFPIHSTSSLLTKYDIEKFIRRVFDLVEKYSFDSILVCLYWKDANNQDLVEIYKSYGCKICSAGHKWDKDFLGRLKTIINLSDVSVSNGVGTHIGYSVILNKPHTVLESDVEYISVGVNGANSLRQEMKNSRLIEVNHVKTGFTRDDGRLYVQINDVQKRLCNKYWGNNELKTSEELFSILS